jgi:hypothetical protein
VAKVLVKTAVAQAVGMDDLVSRLASELDTDSDRLQFTHGCRMGRHRA